MSLSHMFQSRDHYFISQLHDQHLISGVLIGANGTAIILLSINFRLLFIPAKKPKKQKNKKRQILKTFTAEAPREPTWSIFFIYLTSYTDQQYYSVDLCVRQDKKKTKKKIICKDYICSVSTFCWIHIKNSSGAQSEASARFSEWEALKLPRRRTYFQL